jgi:hypothetical protein
MNLHPRNGFEKVEIGFKARDMSVGAALFPQVDLLFEFWKDFQQL